MATLKICTHDRTQWITDVKGVNLVASFLVKDFDDPYKDVPNEAVREARTILVVDFQAPIPAEKVEGDTIGHVLAVERAGLDPSYVVVAPCRCCFLMSDTGDTIDRI